MAGPPEAPPNHVCPGERASARRPRRSRAQVRGWRGHLARSWCSALPVPCAASSWSLSTSGRTALPRPFLLSLLVSNCSLPLVLPPTLTAPLPHFAQFNCKVVLVIVTQAIKSGSPVTPKKEWICFKWDSIGIFKTPLVQRRALESDATVPTPIGGGCWAGICFVRWWCAGL